MNPSASCSSTENSAENSPSRSSHDRATITKPLYPCLLFMTKTSCAAIIALRGRGAAIRGIRNTSQFTVAAPQHFLYFFPEPHGHGSFRLTLGALRRGSEV